MISLAEIEERYEHIMHSLKGKHRNRALAQLMTIMEQEYKIPTVHDPEWESKNKTVIAMYRKISISQTKV
ncbi:hypothetical protein JZ785_25655 [Alicyclobacillus curvatus]|jgi:hypothetical protein|nr:hypothetical protein JZ785_25655 [Alicyclobacillus curvatus]